MFLRVNSWGYFNICMEDWKKVFFQKNFEYVCLKPCMCLKKSGEKNFFGSSCVPGDESSWNHFRAHENAFIARKYKQVV
jgi:hypothetical protein